jgi:hypothetical protein
MRMSAESVSTEMLFETTPFCAGEVFIFAVNVPDPPAGITESCSATVHPQEGLARMMWTSVGPSLRNFHVAVTV